MSSGPEILETDIAMTRTFSKRTGRWRASVRLGPYCAQVSASSNDHLAAEIARYRLVLLQAARSCWPLPSGVAAQVRRDGTVRYRASFGRHPRRLRLATDTLEEAVTWIRHQRAEYRETTGRCVVTGYHRKWFARWGLPLDEDPTEVREGALIPLLMRIADREPPLPPSVQGRVSRDGQIAYEALAEVGPHRRSRSFRRRDDAIAWQQLTKKWLAELGDAGATGNAGIRRFIGTGEVERFRVRVTVRGLTAHETHTTLAQAVEARERLHRELLAQASALERHWRVRVSHRTDGSLSYRGVVRKGQRTLSRRFDALEQAEEWLVEAAQELETHCGPVSHLWESRYAQQCPPLTPSRRRLQPPPKSDRGDDRLWERA